jgi:hypothetical protein
VTPSGWVPITTSSVAGLLGLAGVLLGARATRRVQRESHEWTRQLERESHERAREFEAFRRQLDEEGRTRSVVDRYQEPLVRAAYDLQSRMWNLLHGSLVEFMKHGTQRERDYVRDSTVWLAAQYFGWCEIVRREAQFLALAERDARLRLQEVLSHVADIWSSDTDYSDTSFRIFRSEQRAVGELMIIDGHDAEGHPRTDCMGFAAFRAQLSPDKPLREWAGPLGAFADDLSEHPEYEERIRALQHALIDLVDLVDPDAVRFPHHRTKA